MNESDKFLVRLEFSWAFVHSVVLASDTGLEVIALNASVLFHLLKQALGVDSVVMDLGLVQILDIIVGDRLLSRSSNGVMVLVDTEPVKHGLLSLENFFYICIR